MYSTSTFVVALLSLLLFVTPAAEAGAISQRGFKDAYMSGPPPLSRLVRRQGQRGTGRRPQSSDNKGADVDNNQTAAKQDKQDVQANVAADQGLEVQAIGGIGGVDPATGETLLALPLPTAFCTASRQDLAEGTQKSGGFCSSIPQGQIPAVEKMVSSLIIQPQNNENFAVGQGFTVTVQTSNLQTGFFTVAATEYYTQPQTLNADGIIKGHTHVTIQRLTSTSEAPDANQKEFFKGLNDAAADDGRLSTDVPGNTLNTAGVYRICTMVGSFSHQPVVMPIAQRGAQDDCIRINVGDNNADDNEENNNAGGNGDNIKAGGNGETNNAGGNGGNNNAAANGGANGGNNNDGANGRGNGGRNNGATNTGGGRGNNRGNAQNRDRGGNGGRNNSFGRGRNNNRGRNGQNNNNRRGGFARPLRGLFNGLRNPFGNRGRI